MKETPQTDGFVRVSLQAETAAIQSPADSIDKNMLVYRTRQLQIYKSTISALSCSVSTPYYFNLT